MTAPAQPVQGVEAVAWPDCWRVKAHGNWLYFTDEETAFGSAEMHGTEAQPLYASPVPAPEDAAEPTYAARFERLAGICRRFKWVDAVTPAMNNAQTREALSDLAEWLFADGIDRAIRERDTALASQADGTKGDA